MNRRTGLSILACVTLLSLGGSTGGQAQQSQMSFFITSAGPGKGGNLGGLAGADQLCQLLGATAGAGTKTWRAYLSTQGPGAVNARDRIGGGPWLNAKGLIVAKDLAELHGQNNINKQTALTEKGEPVNGRSDTPNMHDVLTGSQPDGTAFPAGEDTHLRQLDEERRRRGDGGPSRPPGPARRRRVEVLELVTSVARARRGLQSERSEEHRGQRLSSTASPRSSGRFGTCLVWHHCREYGKSR